MTSLGRGLPKLQVTMAAAQAALRDTEGAKQDGLQVYLAARLAATNLQWIERGYWEKGAALTPNLLASPLAANVATTGDQWLFMVDIAPRPWGPNQLAGGDCENLSRMKQVGWQHLEHISPGIISDASLLPEVPHSGNLSLRLKAAVSPKADTAPPEVLESAPISIITPPIPLQAGQIACIRGWVRMKDPVSASADGLMIIDSLGGESLAERIGPTKGWKDRDRAQKGQKPRNIKKHPDKPEDDWQEFILYRATPAACNLTVTFALSGLGEAWVDDVTIQVINQGAAPPAQRPAAAAVLPRSVR